MGSPVRLYVEGFNVIILLRGHEGDAGGLYAVPEEADVARESGVDAAQLVLRVTQSLVLGRRLLLPINNINIPVVYIV